MLQCTGHSVLVAAHTSAGKTVVAEYAFAMALRYVQGPVTVLICPVLQLLLTLLHLAVPCALALLQHTGSKVGQGLLAVKGGSCMSSLQKKAYSA
jgi:hypothetical protein